MTEQESRDIDVLRMLVSTGALNEGNAKVVTRVCDRFVEKCARLACVRETVVGALPPLDEAFRRYGCDATLCGTAKCPQGFTCVAYRIREASEGLRKCLGEEEK